jgi:molybdopterin synthase sulfur carrier subunit
VKVRIYGTLRAVVGGVKETEVQVSGPSTAGEILAQLVAAYPALRPKVLRGENELQGGVGLLVNGRSTRFLQGLDTPVREGDEVALFPPIGGG